MLKNIINAALRNIIRHKTFSFINLLGLSVSMSLCMLIILIVKEQFTYDDFHKDSDRIYQVNTRALYQGSGFDIATVPLPVAQVLRDEYTFAEKVVGVNRQFLGDASVGNLTVSMQGLLVDPSFMNVFNFPFAQGDANTALSSANSLVLTKESAEKLFGKKNAIGQIISFGGYGDFTITGVLEAFPGKTHLDFEVLGSTALLPALERSGKVTQVTGNWSDFYSSFAYVKLKEGSTTQEVHKALAAITEKYSKGLKLEAGYTGYEFSIYPLDELTPGPGLANQMGAGIPRFVLIFLGALAGAVLVMSIFNFTNLTIAKSLTRAREVGIRKIVGAKRSQVFSQFVGESVLFTLVALGFSYIILQFLKAGIAELPLSEHFSVSLQEDTVVYLIFVGFAIFVGVMAGLLPAGYLSAFKPLNVLKDSSNARILSRFTLRKALVTVQFTLCVVFVSTVLIIYSQVNFMVNADYGFKKENVVNVHLQGVAYEKVANEMKKLPGVDIVGGTSHAFGIWNDRKNNYRRDRLDEPVAMSNYWIDDQFADGLGLTFIAGRNFNSDEEGSNERHVILNQKALELFAFTDAKSAIGQSLLVDDSVLVEVIGVVKDFHYRPLSDHIGPMALRYDLGKVNVLSARIDGNKKEEQLASIAAVWKKLDSGHELSYAMLADEIEDAYSQSGMKDLLIIAAYVTVLAVTLACLGMLGMAMYAVQSRVKEVGIRKVMGASAADVLGLLSRSFMILILIATFIGAPVSFLLGQEFLAQFAFRIETGPLLIFLSVVIISVIGLITIGSQAMRAVVANPVRSLRYE